MDKVILGEGVCLEGELGTDRPNNNQIIIGATGTGKSVSILLPTVLNMQNDSVIYTIPKAGFARKIAKYQQSKGYETIICDLSDPDRSTGIFDPLAYIVSYLDVENFAKAVVLAEVPKNDSHDRYWTDGATQLLVSLILGTKMVVKDATMVDVLELFDSLVIEESVGKTITTSLDGFFSSIRDKKGECEAVNLFRDLAQLPYGTASCIRDSLAKSLRRMFPLPIRKMMEKRDHRIDFKKLAREKTSLVIVTSSVNTSLYLFANLLFSTAIKELLEFSEQCPDQRLPRHVRLLFDDFACSSRINDYAKYISIFRAAGISAMHLIQDESQLINLYSESESTTIINNNACYVFMPGGMDLTTCQNISKRLDVPATEIMYAPMGNVIIMRSGHKPITVPRYKTFESKEYKEYLEINHEKEDER